MLSLTRQEFQKDSFLENAIFGWASIFELFTVKGMTVRKHLFFTCCPGPLIRCGRPDRPITKWNDSILPNWESCSRPNCSSLKSRVSLARNSPQFGSTDTPIKFAEWAIRIAWNALLYWNCLCEKDALAIVNWGELLLTMFLWHGLY